MENQNEFALTMTYPQLTLLIELMTQHVALAIMKLNKMQNEVLRQRLQLKIDNDLLLLDYLKAKRDAFTSKVPANGY